MSHIKLTLCVMLNVEPNLSRRTGCNTVQQGSWAYDVTICLDVLDVILSNTPDLSSLFALSPCPPKPNPTHLILNLNPDLSKLVLTLTETLFETLTLNLIPSP